MFASERSLRGEELTSRSTVDLTRQTMFCRRECVNAIEHSPFRCQESLTPATERALEDKSQGNGAPRRKQEGIMCHRIPLSYVRSWTISPVTSTSTIFGLTHHGGNSTEEKLYVVQTDTKVIERCMLMTTDPGDLVLDPTCGSGTTAYVAEQWGRRWITIDTSRVAVAIARQRLLTAKFDFYRSATRRSRRRGRVLPLQDRPPHHPQEHRPERRTRSHLRQASSQSSTPSLPR